MSAIDEFLKVENRCGDCSGESDGSGHGSGYGHGYISRYGCGDGSGGGSGSSIGSGYVYGNGFGGGYGNLSDIQSYCGIPAHDINGEPTIVYSVHGNIAKCAFLKQDMTLEPCYVVKQQPYFAHGRTVREAQEALREKLFAGMPVEDRIQAFLAEFKPGILYPAKEFYEWHSRLTGSCKMGRDAFAREHGIDIEQDMMTVQEFLELTKYAYGCCVIRELENAYRESEYVKKN